MELNLFKNNKDNNESKNIVGDFINELTSFLNKNSQIAQKSSDVENEISNSLSFENQEDFINDDLQNNQNLDENHKEGHLYFVTSDRNNQIFLWDFTDKPEYEFEEKNIPPELKDVAKEGAMLKYENGTFILYSEKGYDMLFDE